MTAADQQIAKQQFSDVSASDSGVLRKATESVASVGAYVAGAFSGALSLGGSASSKRTTTTTSTRGSQLSKREADQLYSGRMEDEYAKQEGGA